MALSYDDSTINIVIVIIIIVNVFYIAELVIEMELKTDSDWSRWTLENWNSNNLVRSEAN